MISEANKQRKKRLIAIAAGILSTILVVYLYSILNRGITTFTSVEFGASNYYNNIQLNNAKDAVMKVFRQEFGGCKLITLPYDETFSKAYCEAEQYDITNTIVFSSSFYVYPWGGAGFLTKNIMIDYWNWVVQYSQDLERWIVLSSGIA